MARCVLIGCCYGVMEIWQHNYSVFIKPLLNGHFTEGRQTAVCPMLTDINTCIITMLVPVCIRYTDANCKDTKNNTLYVNIIYQYCPDGK